MARLVWSKSSRDDLKGIHSFISKDSKYYANSFVDKVNQSVKKLKSFPKIGREVPEFQDTNIREIIFHNYRIIYQIAEHKINILTVFHTSRDLSRFKLEDWEVI